MNINASISLSLCAKYDTPFYTQILHPAERTADINFEKGMLHNLVVEKPPIVLNPVEIEGGWDARRFSVRVQTSRKRSEHYTEHHVLYGFTEPCEEVTDDTKIYLTRVVGLRANLMIVKDEPYRTATVMFDSLVPAQVGKGLFRLTPGSVIRRLASESVFGNFGRTNCIINNGVSAIHLGHRQAFSVGDLSEIGWAAGAERLLKKLNNSIIVEHGDAAREDVLQDISHDAERNHLENVPILEYLRRSSDCAQSGTFTYGELLDVCGDSTSIAVNYTANDRKGSVNPPDVAKQLFDQFARRAMADVSSRGLECSHTEWWSDGFSLQYKGVLERPFFYKSEWLTPTAPSFDETEGARIVDAYDLKSFHVSLLVDAADVIYGRVRLDDGETYEFYVPTFAFSLANGLMVDEDTLTRAVRLMDHAVEHHLRR